MRFGLVTINQRNAGTPVIEKLQFSLFPALRLPANLVKRCLDWTKKLAPVGFCHIYREQDS